MAIERIEIILEGKDGATPTVKSFNRSLGETEKQAKKTKGVLDKLGGSLKGAFAAVGIAMVAKTVTELVSLGVESNRAKTALETMAGGAEEADEALLGVIDASGGALDKLSAMQNATRLFSMGLASNAEEAAKLTDIAITLGATMGKGPIAAFEEMTLLLANQSILRLDTFGISGSRVRDRMNELAQEMPGVNREIRFMTAFMEEAEGKMIALDEAGFEATSNLDVMGAGFKNLKQDIGTTLADAIIPLIDGFVEYTEATKDASDAQSDTQEEIDNLRRGLEGLPPHIAAAKAAWLDEREANLEAVVTLRDTRAEVPYLSGGMRDLAAATDEAAGGLDALVVQGKKLTAQSLGSQALKQLDTALKEGFITQDAYNAGARRIMGSFMDMDQTMINANFTFAEVMQQFEDGELTMEQFVAQTFGVAQAIGELPTSVDIPINFPMGDTSGINKANDIQTSVYSGGGGYATGGSFFVSGPAGVDNVPVGFMASAGEKVTISNGGDEDNSRRTSILEGGVVNINNTQNQKQFEKMLERIGGV